MATLNIGGQRVRVGDEFLSMSPEQQQAAVEEIAASLNLGGGNAYEDALAAASQMSQFAPGQDTAAPPLEPTPLPRPDLAGSTAATLGGIVNAIPIIGPMSQAVSDNLVGLGAQLTGGDYQQARDAAIARREELAAANPVANIAGNLAGGIGSFGALGATQLGAQATGMTGSTLQRMLNSGLSTTGLLTADNMVRGMAPTEALGEALLPGSVSAVVPGFGAVARGGAQAVGERVAPVINSIRNPAEEASRRVGVAVNRDVAANPQMVMNAADEAVARQSGMPLINVDRGGETTRALARSVANQSPEARAIIDRTVEDRFTTQAPRAIEFIKRLTGGAVDDIGYRQAIQDTARVANKPRYDRAFNSPSAQQVFTAETQELMQSPAIQRAIDMTQSRSRDLAAIAGQVPIENPFRKGSDGVWRVVQKANGTFAVPNLAFWDQVKRNLDGMIGVAQRGGDNTEYAVLNQIKTKLVNSLDEAVPDYRAARQGAASFFGAEDALDAGRAFANQPRQIPEATRAFNQFTKAEKDAFATGYASELIDKIKASGDRRNVIQQVFGSPASREMNELVFGKGKATQLEAFVRVEMLADQLRSAMGNSTTARQLVELGIGAGVGGVGGFGLSGGDWQTALQGAVLGAGTAGARIAGQRVDAKVMEDVAKLLTSDNPRALQQAVYNASMSPKWMLALDQMAELLAPASRGAIANPEQRMSALN